MTLNIELPSQVQDFWDLWFTLSDLLMALQKFSKSPQDFQSKCIGDARIDDEISVAQSPKKFVRLRINSRRRKKETGHSFERQMKNWLGGHRSISVICWKGHTACGIQEQPELWTLRPLGSFLSLSFIYLSASFPQLASFTWKLSNRSGSIHKEKCMKDTAKIMEEVCNDWNLETHGMSDMML